MKKTKVFTSALSLFLAILIMFYTIPATVFAAESYALPESVEAMADSLPYGAPTVEPFEVVELREENVKHFRTEDGSFVAAMYDYPVHYYDENGALRDNVK